jgi:hypothetical protein
MARAPNPEIREQDLHGFKHFKLLLPALEKLHHHACESDKAGNRILHYDQYMALILLYFFNPIVTSLRGIQQASELQKVQRKLECARASLGSLSEAARVFDADLLRGVIGDLVERLGPIAHHSSLDDIRGIITLVDGTLLPAPPKIVEALWRHDGHKAFKLHTHFELLKGVPVRADLTDANAGETRVLKTCLQPDRVYVMDRGYTDFALFRQILNVVLIPKSWMGRASMRMDITLLFEDQVLCPRVLGTRKEPHDVRFEYSTLLSVCTHEGGRAERAS